MTKFSFVSAERAKHAVAALCRVVGASVSGFYAWLRAIPAVQSRADDARSRHQGANEAAEEGFASAPGVVHELEEGEVERQLASLARRPDAGAARRSGKNLGHVACLPRTDWPR